MLHDTRTEEEHCLVQGTIRVLGSCFFTFVASYAWEKTVFFEVLATNNSATGYHEVLSLVTAHQMHPSTAQWLFFRERVDGKGRIFMSAVRTARNTTVIVLQHD